MSKPETYSNESLTQLLADLEQMQHYLLTVKAASLAFNGFFNEECPRTDAVSPFSREETAEYFVNQFLDLDPDAKLEQAMDAIRQLKTQAQPKHRQSQKTNKATIDISIRNLDVGGND